MANVIPKPLVEYDMVDGEQKVLHYFTSVLAAHKFYLAADPPIAIWPQLIYQTCNGKWKWAKRHYFRWATPEETQTMNQLLQSSEIEKEITPGYDDHLPEHVIEGPIEYIGRKTIKTEDNDNESPFEVMLRKMRGQ
jgi:hypothetical protein